MMASNSDAESESATYHFRVRFLITTMILLITILAVCSVAAAERVGDIEYFGYGGLRISDVKHALPVHEGDAYSADTKVRMRQAIAEVLGRQPTDIAAICCDNKGNRLVFIGLPGASIKVFTYDKNPASNERLPSEIVELYSHVDQAIEAAVRKGGKAAQEDDSNGYSLINDETGRSLQLRVREWALTHERELIKVLQSSFSVEDRRVASDALGYARQSPEQINALVRAARDPDEEVRNNATRALGVLVRSNQRLAMNIPPETFIKMLNSGIWTDRNKGASLLMQLTTDRRPDLLMKIRLAAFDSLIEMAAWRDASHAFFARMILGRVAGIPEDRLQKLAWNGPASAIIAAAGAH